MTEALTREKILEAAEQVLRRFGPAKTTVVDVARALGVSHGSVYRHFASKAELRDALVEQWLKRTSDPLEKIARGSDEPLLRLRKWLKALAAAKRKKAQTDAEMFAAAKELFALSGEVIARHVATLEGQVAAILQDGVDAGDFAINDVQATARGIFDATVRFHDPAHAKDWADTAATDAAFERVWALIAGTLAAKP